MITSILQGGLGNQLFQISAAISLAKKHSDEAVFSMETHYLPQQGRKVNNYADNVLRNIKFSPDLSIRHLYQEPYFHYRKIEYKPDMCLRGYFQSEKYFKEHEDYIRNIFSPDERSLDIIDSKYSTLLEKSPVAIHVRRGDYLQESAWNHICSLEYFRESMTHFEKDTTFLIVSDDIEWCKKSFDEKNIVFIENNLDYIDLYLISLCRGVIMSNSTFSWWGSWLNQNPSKTVIAPKQWFLPVANLDFKDIVPPEWIKL
tara:strand:- start:151108 stop:151881 length:774 start_codon:yes stop_codon:yes gene_type:complete